MLYSPYNQWRESTKCNYLHLNQQSRPRCFQELWLSEFWLIWMLAMCTNCPAPGTAPHPWAISKWAIKRYHKKYENFRTGLCSGVQKPGFLKELLTSDMDKTLIFILNSIISTCPLKFLYLLISSLQITLNIRNIKLSELGIRHDSVLKRPLLWTVMIIS